MKLASAIVTNRGGRTCHAAIIARELGIPAVVACGDATERLKDGSAVTVSCAEGDTGYVYAGDLNFSVSNDRVDKMPELPFKIMMNVGNPDRAFSFAGLPHKGVGLARLEFIINRMVGVHPKALLEFDSLEPSLQRAIVRYTAGYKSPVDFFVEKIVEGVSTIAAAFAPEPVIVRMSDFKSNEYAHLLGGEHEAKQVIELLAEQGLKRGEKGLKIIMMCELPSNALLADAFLDHFDGFFDERNDAVKALLKMAITACKARGKYIGICGQGPSDHPDFAEWLIEQGIDSVSLNPDSVIDTWMHLAKNT